jgi:cytochrome c oxidase assembly factor CtaG
MAGGLGSIAVALLSPLDALADRLLSAHMMQHLLLCLIAAPLIVLATPLRYLVWGLPRAARHAVGHAWMKARWVRQTLENPSLAWGLFCATLVLWHVPSLYRWATAEELRHSLMHLSFLGAGVLFWSVILAPSRPRRLNYAACGLYVFVAAIITGLPGALIAFAQQPLYKSSGGANLPFGLSVMSDQQLAGLLMWIPMDLVLFSVSLALFGLALRNATNSPRAASVSAPCPPAFTQAGAE